MQRTLSGNIEMLDSKDKPINGRSSNTRIKRCVFVVNNLYSAFGTSLCSAHHHTGYRCWSAASRCSSLCSP